jgi:F0F1-type ATP synthase membrane subunit c/vacuolar-type H+-ATPase subunit K
MKFKDYARQPSTWLGLAKLGAAIGLYSTGVGGAVAQGIVALFGILDVLRNEKTE